MAIDMGIELGLIGYALNGFDKDGDHLRVPLVFGRLSGAIASQFNQHFIISEKGKLGTPTLT